MLKASAITHGAREFAFQNDCLLRRSLGKQEEVCHVDVAFFQD
jgi:hypothetical protein